MTLGSAHFRHAASNYRGTLVPRRIRANRDLRTLPLLRVPVSFLLALISSHASAYEVPLTPSALHDAFVLGQRNDQATAVFLNPYLKALTERSEAPHIAEIEVLTPFAQVVDQSRLLTSGYSEQQAARDYQQRGDTFLVRVLVMLPAAYPKPDQSNSQPNAPVPSTAPSADQNAALRPENFWQNFRFALKQHGKVIPTRSIHNKPVHSTPTSDAPAVLDGATVWLEYDAKDVASEEITIEVVAPDSKTISAVFDLRKLR
jgi:hypothetical protein